MPLPLPPRLAFLPTCLRLPCWPGCPITSAASLHLLLQGKKNPVLSHPTVLEISQRLRRTPGQVVLRWALQHGQVGGLLDRAGAGQLAGGRTHAGWVPSA